MHVHKRIEKDDQDAEMRILGAIIFLNLFSTLTMASTCPMDLSYVQTIPWNSSYCHGYHPMNSPQTDSKGHCCETLLSLYGIALAQRLKDTSLFHLPNLPTSVSCLSDFQSQLDSMSLPSNLTSICFTPSQFVITPNVCAGIETKQDWINKLGTNTSLDQACRPDLSALSQCDACATAGLKIQSQLISVDGNTSHATNCFYFAILYAAGIANEFGPQSVGAMSCIFELQLITQLDQEVRAILGSFLD
ncbi:hypothetical protein Ancab_026894 [Ancistrocladus abbreviatus]